MRNQKKNSLVFNNKSLNKKINFLSLSKSYLKSKMLQDMLYTSSPASTRAEVVNFSTFGLQCRSAFLSNKFVNFCLSLPIEYMIKNGYTKWLIRYSMKDYLPKVVLWKKEHVGLNAPANIWFRSELKNELIKKIKSLCFRKEVNFINRKVLDNIMQDHFSKKNDHMMFLWKLYSLESWLLKWKF
jgi:asparagine synthase (glutamine-hydrolysing)